MPGYNPYHYNQYGRATFVTGGGIPGRQRVVVQQDSDSDQEPDEDIEDQLLREVEQHQNDFKDMFGQLNEVDGMLHGDDLYYMRQMKDISGHRMHDHLKNYDKIQNNMVKLAEDAVNSMQSVGKYDNRAKKIA